MNITEDDITRLMSKFEDGNIHPLDPLLGFCQNFTDHKDKDGYGIIGISGKNRRVHRLIVIINGIYIPPGKIVMHSCNNPSCGNIKHLKVGTHSENSKYRDKLKRRLLPLGERCNFSKLKAEQVLEIRELAATGKYTQQEISDKFNVQRVQIGRIINRKRWTHI